MRLSIFDLGGRQEILAGAIPGTNLFAKAVTKIRRCVEPTPLFLDFAGVAMATSSFLQESVLGIRDYCRNAGTNLYPVVANANKIILEELQITLENRGEAMLTCQVDSHGNVSNATVIGVLEEKQEMTLEAVKVLKKVNAGTLMERFKATEKIGITGWHNRLSSLVAKGLLIEIKKGRTKHYQTVLELS